MSIHTFDNKICQRFFHPLPSSSNGRYIISGSSDGCVYGWSLDGGDSLSEPPALLESCLQYKAHKDVVNGVRYGCMPTVLTHTHA